MNQSTPQHPDWFDLSHLTTMAVPARAKELRSVSSVSELKAALDAAQALQLPFLMLGDGSNTVFVGDYHGMVILNRLRGIEVVAETETTVTVRAAAGEDWHAFVECCVNQAWYGLENLALIPGLVGAAPIQNIGAYGVEVKDTITHVEVFDIASGKMQTLSNDDCHFAYRESRFKQEWSGNKLVTAVSFELSKSSHVSLDYPALKQALMEQGIDQPQAIDVFNAVVAIRSAKLPAPAQIPNAGSFFKNPIVDRATHDELKTHYPNLVAFSFDGGYKLAAGWLIEQAGWKQREINGVGVHQQQALVVVNPQRCDGVAIEQFAQAVQADILQRFGVQLEIEPRVVRSG